MQLRALPPIPPLNSLVPTDPINISWASERHLSIEVGHDISPTTHARVQAVVHAISKVNPRSLGILDIIPAYATVVLTLDLHAIERLGAGHIERMVRQATACLVEPVAAGSHVGARTTRVLEIPVCYAPAFALDLADVAEMHSLTPRDVIRVHTSAEYFVHFVGFSPGFAYLGGLPTQLETPRLDKPRVRVPAGSVAIAGSQAGVYPHATPGGWRILGRTPLKIFDARREPASLVAMGDRVRFVEIGEAELERIERERHRVESERAVAQSTSIGRESQPTPNPFLRDGLQIRVLDPGLFATIQDLGRPGHAAMGVPESGAADPRSLRVANRLLGNDENAAAIELTLKGGEYEFTQETQVCVVGANMPIAIRASNGSSRLASLATPIPLRTGERLQLGVATSGARAYLAVGGGFHIPSVLASRSTLVSAGVGGLDGRALRAGDVLRICSAREVAGERNPPQTPSPKTAAERPAHQGTHVFRVVDGAHATHFRSESAVAFARAEFAIGSNSDRMGLRLHGPQITPPGGGRLLSEGMMWGAIQITESGQPIVLMPDHPTTGGYPVVACVIAADLPRLGQLRPNERVKFERVSLEHARAAWSHQEAELARILA